MPNFNFAELIKNLPIREQILQNYGDITTQFFCRNPEEK